MFLLYIAIAHLILDQWFQVADLINYFMHGIIWNSLYKHLYMFIYTLTMCIKPWWYPVLRVCFRGEVHPQFIQEKRKDLLGIQIKVSVQPTKKQI